MTSIQVLKKPTYRVGFFIPKRSENMKKTKIFIDAGHNNTSFNTGALGNGMKEQDITFEVSKLLGDILKKDFDIKLSRPTKETNLGTDNTTAINSRWQMSNSWGADFFISIHANAGGGSGVETFINNNRSMAFGTTVNNTYANVMGLRNRGVKTGNFAVITHTHAKAILIELAFIDSPLTNPDVNILRNKRKEMAQAIAKGVYSHTGVTPSEVKEEEYMVTKLELTRNGKNITTNNIFHGGKNYVELRDYEESYGNTVNFNNMTRKINITSKKSDVNNVKFSVDGNKFEIDGVVINDFNMVRARDLLENIGYKVTWENATIVGISK
jgi:N-acetylmuramoyl-L-alanine amidase